MSDYRIERITADQFDLLVPLMKDCFGMDTDINYFKWKYVENPAGSFIGFIALQEATNEVAAYYGVIPQVLVIEGREQVIYQSCDTMTHSRHRRKGLFKKLARACYDYLREQDKLFIIGFGGADSTPGFLSFGWKQTASFRYYLRPSFLCRLLGRENAHIVENPGDAILQSILEKLEFPKAIHSPRTLRHLRWRTSNPRFQYHITAIHKQRTGSGYIAWYVQDRKLIIFDLQADRGRARRILLNALGSIVVKNNYRGLIAYAQDGGHTSQHFTHNLFFSNPFRKGPLSERTPFIFYATEEQMQKFDHKKAWEMTAYDHDAL